MRPSADTKLLYIYLLSHIYGLAAGYILSQGLITSEVSVAAEQSMSGGFFLIMLLTATLLMLALYRYSLGLLIKAWFTLSILLTGLVFFLVFFPFPLALGLTAAAFTIRSFTHSFWTRNLMDTFSYAGAGTLFGSMIGFIPALFLLGALALYDIIAVFFTRHMVGLVQEGIATDTFMGLIYPKDNDTTPATGDETHEKQAQQPAQADSGSPPVEVGIVGGGDIVVPMIFAVSTIYRFGVLAGAACTLGATVGLAFLLRKSSEGTYYPAVPIVGGGAVLGLGLYLLPQLLLQSL